MLALAVMAVMAVAVVVAVAGCVSFAGRFRVDTHKHGRTRVLQTGAEPFRCARTYALASLFGACVHVCVCGCACAGCAGAGG